MSHIAVADKKKLLTALAAFKALYEKLGVVSRRVDFVTKLVEAFCRVSFPSNEVCLVPICDGWG
jgi:hypothetical protein